MRYILLILIFFIVPLALAEDVSLPEYKLDEEGYDYFAGKSKEEIVRIDLVFKTTEQAQECISSLKEVGVNILTQEQERIKIETTMSLLNKISSIDEIISIEPEDRRQKAKLRSPKTEISRDDTVEITTLNQTNWVAPDVSYEDKFIDAPEILELTPDQRITVEILCSEINLDQIQELGINVLEITQDKIKIAGEVEKISKLASCDWVLAVNQYGVSKKERDK